jgi:hypothetical protein
VNQLPEMLKQICGHTSPCFIFILVERQKVSFLKIGAFFLLVIVIKKQKESSWKTCGVFFPLKWDSSYTKHLNSKNQLQGRGD